MSDDSYSYRAVGSDGMTLFRSGDGSEETWRVEWQSKRWQNTAFVLATAVFFFISVILVSQVIGLLPGELAAWHLVALLIAPVLMTLPFGRLIHGRLPVNAQLFRDDVQCLLIAKTRDRWPFSCELSCRDPNGVVLGTLALRGRKMVVRSADGRNVLVVTRSIVANALPTADVSSGSFGFRPGINYEMRLTSSQLLAATLLVRDVPSTRMQIDASDSGVPRPLMFASALVALRSGGSPAFT